MPSAKVITAVNIINGQLEYKCLAAASNISSNKNIPIIANFKTAPTLVQLLEKEYMKQSTNVIIQI